MRLTTVSGLTKEKAMQKRAKLEQHVDEVSCAFCVVPIPHLLPASLRRHLSRVGLHRGERHRRRRAREVDGVHEFAHGKIT